MSSSDDNHTVLTRRRLLQMGGGATAALYFGGLPGLAVADSDPAYLRRSSYASRIGSPFGVVDGGGGATTLNLAAVDDLVRAQTDPAFVGRDDAFALAFTGPQNRVLASAVHELSHATLGRFSVFISPVDDGSDGQRYEVVVDRSVAIASAQQAAPQPLAQSNAAPVAAGAPSAAALGPARTVGAAHLVTAASVARRGTSLTADVHVARGHEIVAVSVTLSRGAVRYARAESRLHGRVAIRLTLRRLRAVTAGAYELAVTTTDRRGRRVVERRRVTVRGSLN
jgi:hypothetical protein